MLLKSVFKFEEVLQVRSPSILSEAFADARAKGSKPAHTAHIHKAILITTKIAILTGKINSSYSSVQTGIHTTQAPLQCALIPDQSNTQINVRLHDV